MAKIKIWKKWRKTIFLLFLILVLGLFLRIIRLTSLPIFGDEAIYIRWAQIMRAEPGLRFVPLSDGKQPLFVWGVIAFLKVFSNPLLAGRIVSVFSGTMSLVGIFVLSNLLFENKKASLISSIVYAISPYGLFYDRLALVDSMLSMFGVWAFVFAIVAAKKIRLDSSMLAGFALGGALLTKSPAVYFVMLLPSVLLLSSWPKNLKEKFNHLSVFVFLFTFTYLIAYGMYNILRLGSNFHMIAIRNKDYVYPLNHILTSPLDPLKPFLNRTLIWFWKLGPSVFIIMVFLGVIKLFKDKSKEVLLLLGWSFIPILVSAEYAKTFTPRYILYTFPYLVILGSLMFTKGVGLQIKNRKINFFGLIFSIFILNALWIDYLLLTNVEKAPLPRVVRSGFLEEWTAGTGIHEVAVYIRNEHQSDPQRKIVVGTEGYFGTLPDAMQIYLNDLSEITVIGTGLDFKKVPIQLIESVKSGNKTYFVVNSSRLIADYNDLNLELLASYPKAVRLDGSRETLYFFEVKNQKN